MPFGVVGRTGVEMRQVVGLLGKYGAPHCNQWGLCGVAVRKCVNRRSCGLGWCMGCAEALLYYVDGVYVVVVQGKWCVCGAGGCSPILL